MVDSVVMLLCRRVTAPGTDQSKCTELMKELWQPIPGFEETYEASDQGRIRSIDRVVTQPCRWAGVETISYKRKGKILRQASRKEQNSNYGRKFVNLWGGTPRRSYPTLVHHLVAFTFIGPRPKGLEIDHVNGDKTDNRACNLEYVTHAENVRRHNALKELSPWQQLPLFDRITLLPRSEVSACVD